MIVPNVYPELRDSKDADRSFVKEGKLRSHMRWAVACWDFKDTVFESFKMYD